MTDARDSTELKSCPFCGCSEARLEEVGYGQALAAVCRECDASGPAISYDNPDSDEPEESTKQAARDAWNRRHD